MKKLLIISPVLLAMAASTGLSLNHQKQLVVSKATGGTPTYSTSLPTTIDLNDNSDDEIRDYYAALESLSDEERSGTNILKNLKPILQNFTYYGYDAAWKMYEITDRDWNLSPAEGIQYGTYDSTSNSFKNYQYGTSASNSKNNPYLHDLYKNLGDDGSAVENGRIKAWDNHGKTAGGTDREHVWCQSRGFKANNGAEGPAGTDIHHLIAGDSRTNQTLHNNNPYGNVDKTKPYEEGTKYLDYLAGNLKGSPLKTSAEDQSTVVFEPQDSDKGDIARACFYMAACYNNWSGAEDISQYNPNLILVNYATSGGEREDSSASHPVAMGIVSDLLEWNELDPVDEYEIHRNNLIYNNYQHNRNPFIDFPEWANYIWGDKVGQSIDSRHNKINEGYSNAVKLSKTKASLKVDGTFEINAVSEDESAITWSVSDTSVLSLSKTTSSSGENITVTALKEGTAKISASVTISGETTVKTCLVTVSNSSAQPNGEEGNQFTLEPWMIIVAAVVVVIVVVVLIAVPASRKKAKKLAKKTVKSAVKSQTKSSSSKKKKK